MHHDQQLLPSSPIVTKSVMVKINGGSRISRRGGVHPLGGAWTSNVGRFSVKMYAKMKELGPIGGGVRPARPPPRSANEDYMYLVRSVRESV